MAPEMCQRGPKLKIKCIYKEINLKMHFKTLFCQLF